MKNHVFTFLLLSCLSLFLSPAISAQSFKGKWQGTSNGEVGQMTFDKEGYVIFIINKEPMGGKKFTASGVDLSMRYEYNDKVTPHTIDFVLSMVDGGTEISRMLGIYEFKNKKSLIINMDFDGKARPEKFDPESQNQITLLKVK